MPRLLIVFTAITLAACTWYPNREIAYLERHMGSATVQDVEEEFGPATGVQAREDGSTVRVYRYEGVSGPMLLDVTEVWCVEYVLTFDPEGLLRTWVRRDCLPD